MNRPISILVIEDSPSDADLVVRYLEKAGYAVHATRVETAAELRAALTAPAFKIVICDYRLPGFDPPAALEIVRASGYDVPFLVVSGAIGEEHAVAIMKAGAHDCIMKTNLTRLAPAVERELREPPRARNCASRRRNAIAWRNRSGAPRRWSASAARRRCPRFQ